MAATSGVARRARDDASSSSAARDRQEGWEGGGRAQGEGGRAWEQGANRLGVVRAAGRAMYPKVDVGAHKGRHN